MPAVSDAFRRVRNPEYTGDDRCRPCTVINLLVAFALCAAVEVAVVRRGLRGPALFAGQALFVVAVGVVYLRGYLIPGTPALTRRYLPPWLLRFLGKRESVEGLTGGDRSQRSGEDDAERDAVRVLEGTGVLTDRDGGSEGSLAPEFRRALRDGFPGDGDDGSERELLLDALGAPSGDVRFDSGGNVFRARRNGTEIGTWESRPAFLADVTAATLLGDRIDRWETRAVRERGRLLRELRSFLRTCPDCRGELTQRTATVETCCSTYDVTRLTCPDCDATVYESKTEVGS